MNHAYAILFCKQQGMHMVVVEYGCWVQNASREFFPDRVPSTMCDGMSVCGRAVYGTSYS
jgi:hypothetical protein